MTFLRRITQRILANHPRGKVNIDMGARRKSGQLLAVGEAKFETANTVGHDSFAIN